MGRWQECPIGILVLASCAIVGLSQDSGSLQQHQGFNASESIQHLQGILESTAAQAAGMQSIYRNQWPHDAIGKLIGWHHETQTILLGRTLHRCMSGVAEGCRTAGWYFKSVEAAIFATAASEEITQGLSVGAHISLKLAPAWKCPQHPCMKVVIMHNALPCRSAISDCSGRP